MKYDAIFLSPHLDDAVYSCGGTIAKLTQQGKSVLVVTITAGSPNLDSLSEFAQQHHDRWPANSEATIIETRRDEDARALGLLGADYRHDQILDCIYRTNESDNHLYQTESELFGKIHSQDGPTIAATALTIVQVLSEHLNASDTCVYAPLRVGNHVDHQVVFASTKGLIKKSKLARDQVFFYEDYPYHETQASEPELDTEGRWQPVLVDTTQAQNQLRIQAMALYASQMSDFWDDTDDLTAQLTARWDRYGRAERFWQLSA